MNDQVLTPWSRIKDTVDTITADRCLESGITLYKVMRHPIGHVPGQETVIDERGTFRSLQFSPWEKTYQLNVLQKSAWPMFCFESEIAAQEYAYEYESRHTDRVVAVFKCCAFDEVVCPQKIYSGSQRRYWQKYQLALHQDNSNLLREVMDEAMPALNRPEGTILTHGLVPIEMCLPYEIYLDGENEESYA